MNLVNAGSSKGGTERMAPIQPKVVDYLSGCHKSINLRPRSWTFCANSPDRSISIAVIA